jgi:hypothetical protein
VKIDTVVVGSRELAERYSLSSQCSLVADKDVSEPICSLYVQTRANMNRKNNLIAIKVSAATNKSAHVIYTAHT